MPPLFFISLRIKSAPKTISKMSTALIKPAMVAAVSQDKGISHFHMEMPTAVSHPRPMALLAGHINPTIRMPITTIGKVASSAGIQSINFQSVLCEGGEKMFDLSAVYSKSATDPPRRRLENWCAFARFDSIRQTASAMSQLKEAELPFWAETKASNPCPSPT